MKPFFFRTEAKKKLLTEMAAEFIAKDNICGQNLLQIVAAGNAIIAEVCRLKDHIPEVFQ